MNDHDRLVDAHSPFNDSTDLESGDDVIRQDAIQDERRRVSRELHDGVAQQLVSLGYLLDELATADDPAKVAETAVTAKDQVDLIRAVLRRTIDDLRGGADVADRPRVTEHTGHTDAGGADDLTGLGAALASFAHETGQRSGLDVHVTCEGADRRLAEAAELLWIGREAIANAVRHSGADALWLTLVAGPTAVRLEVADDGSGLDAAGRSDEVSGHGLSIMAERCERMGGSVHIGDRPGGGTVVTVSTGEEHDDDGAGFRTTGRRS